MPRILAVVIASILSIGAASAQDAAPLTLDEAINAARGMSPAIEAASAGVRASNAARTIAGLRPNPSLEAQTENVTGTGPYRRFDRSEEHTSELQSLMRISYAVFCLQKKNKS